jgi:hypothetical protein
MPTPEPTAAPTEEPTAAPTFEPTAAPTPAPTAVSPACGRRLEALRVRLTDVCRVLSVPHGDPDRRAHVRAHGGPDHRAHGCKCP